MPKRVVTGLPCPVPKSLQPILARSGDKPGYRVGCLFGQKEGPERPAVYSLTILLAFPRPSTSYPCLLSSSTCLRVFSQILSDQTGLGLTGRVFAGTVSWAALYPEGLTGLSGNDGFEGIDAFNPFGMEGLTVEVTPCCCGRDCRVDLRFLFNPSVNPRLEIFVPFNPWVA